MIVSVSTTIRRETYDKVRDSAGKRGCSVDAFLRGLIKSQISKEAQSQITVKANAA
jgi:hypothetical protein